jgi:hypothetical protein
MNSSYLTGAIAAAGLLANAAWAVFNSRMEAKVMAHIDGLKTWIGANYYDRAYIDARDRDLGERLSRAGA